MTLCFGIIDRDACPVGEDSAWLGQIELSDRVELIRNAASWEANRYSLAGAADFPAILCAAPPEIAERWDLIPASLVAHAQSVGAHLVCAVGLGDTKARFDAIGDVLGISPSVMRTVHALYRHGDVKRAAKHAGVSFHTAREHLNAARVAIGVANLPMLIMLLNTASIAIPNSGDESDHFIAALFDLTPRQLSLASSIANGSTRRQCADEHAISDALAKKELATIFALLGVSSALGLSRIFSDARAIAIITRYRANLSPGPAVEKRVLTLSDARQRRIVADDYGPQTGMPVLIFHSSMTTRSVNRQLVAALQGKGFRPLSIDRPGFGGTDVVPGMAAGKHDPFQTAAEDVVTFCDHLGLARIDVVTRGAAQAMLGLQALAPERVGRVVLTNPDPDFAFSSKREGRVGAFKHVFVRRPWAVAAMARVIASLATFDRIVETIRRSVETCPPDRIVMQEHENLVDYYRGVEPMHKGQIQGFINEQVAMATREKPAPMAGTGPWQVLIGADDFMHDPQETERYWSDILPEAMVRRVQGAGRFLTYSHSEVVAAALLSQPPQMDTPTGHVEG